jgi:glutamyl-tRNA synthetase
VPRWLTGAARVADGRYAPSPTGPLHLGNLRTALLAWLFARSSGGRFALRVDDLDPIPMHAEIEARQLTDLAALGIDWDGEVLHQLDRRDVHDAAITRLVDADLTYPCWCTRREVLEAPSAPHAPPGAYPGTCRERSGPPDGIDRPPALRLRAGDVSVEVDDRFHGRFVGVVDDFVLRRGDGAPAYNLAVVVDDDAQGVQEVVRGDDLLASTPRQVHLAGMLGIRPPAYAHVPLVLGPDGGRLAKRHGAATLDDIGSPAEVLALLARSLELAASGEAVTASQLVDRFDPDRVPRAPWTFSPPKGP